jgi:hypothetical protein
MDSTADDLARVLRFARPMDPTLPAVDVALGEARSLFAAADVHFKIVGGVAVLHHGYRRTTEDIDVLVEANALEKLTPALASRGFERAGAARLRHVATGVLVDLLEAGSLMPRVGGGAYPSPDEVEASARDASVVGLSALIELKLRSRRHRDIADVVELIKRLDDARYIDVEAKVALALRPALADLRRDALDEIG